MLAFASELNSCSDGGKKKPGGLPGPILGTPGIVPETPGPVLGSPGPVFLILSPVRGPPGPRDQSCTRDASVHPSERLIIMVRTLLFRFTGFSTLPGLEKWSKSSVLSNCSASERCSRPLRGHEHSSGAEILLRTDTCSAPEGSKSQSTEKTGPEPLN